MIRSANFLIYVLTLAILSFICYDLYQPVEVVDNDDLAILSGKFDKRGRLLTKRKFKNIYTRVKIDTLAALKIPPKIIQALDHQDQLLRKSNQKKYKIGSLTFDKTALLETTAQLKQMIANNTIHQLKDSFQFYQLKGSDKKGNIRFTGYYVPEIKSSKTPLPTMGYPVQTCTEQGAQEVVGYVESKEDMLNIKLQGSGYLIFSEQEKILVGYSGRLKKEILKDESILNVPNPEEIEIDEDSLESIIQTDITNLNSDDCFVVMDKRPSGAGVVPLTSFCSIAVDRRYIPLGACLLGAIPILNDNGSLLHHKYCLLLAQDIGGAIIGKGHVDYYHGVGEKNGEIASKLNHFGQLWLILPNKVN